MRSGPFLGSEARTAGLVTRRTLRSRHQLIYQNVYLPEGQQLTAQTRAVAAWLWARRAATVAGRSAAALHGSKWIDAGLPAELIRPVAGGVAGIVVHRDTLHPDEACVLRGVPVTTPARTAYDIGRRETPTQAVIRLDALANATGVRAADVTAVIDRHRGARGLVQLRRAVDLMDGGAQSPQETRTRLLLMEAGFPRPRTQITVCDDFGYFIGRIDIGWPEWKVGIEYDGPGHWADSAAHAHTIERVADLEAQNWTIIRLSRDILRYRSGVFLARVRDAMRAAGWPDHASIRLDARLGP
ncbi:endonuclease domain-containing protein [Mycolicibacterium thermoresistibile]